MCFFIRVIQVIGPIFYVITYKHGYTKHVANICFIPTIRDYISFYNENIAKRQETIVFII